MPTVNFRFAAVDATLTSGTITLWSPRLRPGGTAAITSEKRQAMLTAGVAEMDLEPGPVVGFITGNGGTHELAFTVPSQDGDVAFLDLLAGNYVYEPEIIQAAQQAAREARLSATSAASSAAVVGSAKRVLDAEAASVSAAAAAAESQSAASVSASAAGSSASAAGVSASDAAGSAASASASAGAASADAGLAAADRVQTGLDRARTGEDAASAASSRSAAETAKSQAESARGAAAGHAEAASVSAAAAAQSEGVAGTAAADAAADVRDHLQGVSSATEGYATAAQSSAVAAHQSAVEAATVVSDGVADASASVKGKLQLAGDLSGTAEAPTVPGLVSKSDEGHSHAITDVTNLESTLAGKVAATSTGNRLYGTASGGAQTQVQYANAATASTIPYRGTNGTLPVGAPTSGEHATTKTYVDDAVGTKASSDKFQVVSALPASPVAGVFYFVTG